MSAEYALLRHFLAALAYRTQKALRGAPPEFADFQAGNRARTPGEIVRHMTSVLGYARVQFRGGTCRPKPLDSFDAEVARFHGVLADLAHHLESGDPLRGTTPERLLQGPLSDAMTHAGQLALLRRVSGCPVPPENFMLADVDPDNVGEHQGLPRHPKREWPERLQGGEDPPRPGPRPESRRG